MNQQRPLFYNFTIDNTKGNDDLLLDQLDKPYTEMLPKASDYNVSIIKFTLPNEAETFIIDDDSYTVRLGMRKPSQENPNQVKTMNNYTYVESMTKRDEFKIRSVADFLENLNRTLIRAHLSLMVYLHTIPELVNEPITDYGTHPTIANYTATFEQFDPVGGRRFFGIPGFKRQVRYSGIVVRLTITSLGFGNGGPRFVQAWLSNNAGVTVALTGNRLMSPYIEYIFTDASLNTQVPDLPLPTTCQPLEPFSKILTSNETGTSDWSVYIEHSDQINITVKIRLYESPKWQSFPRELGDTTGHQCFMPYVPPAFKYDEQTHQVSMILQDRQSLSSYSIGFSPRLYDCMPFDGFLNGTHYTLRIPQAAYLPNTDPAYPDPLSGSMYKSFVYPSPYPNLVFRLLDINTIIIGSTLAVAAEQEAQTNSKTLMSLDVTGSDFSNNLYQFVSNQLSTRVYQLLFDGPLTEIGIQVYYRYRSTNRLERAYLPPRTMFSMLLKFTPNSQPY